MRSKDLILPCPLATVIACVLAEWVVVAEARVEALEREQLRRVRRRRKQNGRVMQ